MVMVTVAVVEVVAHWFESYYLCTKVIKDYIRVGEGSRNHVSIKKKKIPALAPEAVLSQKIACWRFKMCARDRGIQL